MIYKSSFLSFIFISLSAILLGCPDTGSTVDPSFPDASGNEGSGKEITVNFNYDNTYISEQWPNIYVAWLENDTGEIQHLYVCNRLRSHTADKTIDDDDSSLPFWRFNTYDSSDSDMVADADSVSGATYAEQSFTLDGIEIESRIGDQFKVYFEMDQAFEYNDAFPGSIYQIEDQPAVLYMAEIDLTAGNSDYTLQVQGFTPMYDFSTYAAATDPIVLTTADQALADAGTFSFAKGVLFSDMSYITNTLTTSGTGDIIFGEKYEDTADNNSSIRCISSITASISDAP